MAPERQPLMAAGTVARILGAVPPPPAAMFARGLELARGAT